MASLLVSSFVFSLLLISILAEPTIKVVGTDAAVDDYTGPMTPELLAKFKDMESFKMTNSNITDYPNHPFSFMPKLSKISIFNSHFKILDLNIYTGADSLREIDFAQNDVPELPLVILRQTPFKKIVIRDQKQVKIIPQNFANETKNLEYFECSNCDIKTIEDGAFNNLDKLETLTLKHNWVPNLNKQILGPLKNLKHLNLQKNIIEKFSTDDISGLNHLETIDLSSNPLSELKLSDIAKVAPNLKSIDIKNTPISKSQLDDLKKTTNIQILSDLE